MQENDKKAQAAKFRQAARELEADQNEERFKRLVEKIAKKPTPAKSGKKA